MADFNIRCKKCKATRLISIYTHNGRQLIDWRENLGSNHKIVSGRKRLDNQWGWQCLCGNYDILTEQETKEITDKANPDPLEIAKVLKNIMPQETKFAMERV